MDHDGRITIKDIAKETNLSIATVSRVLANTGEHNGETVKKSTKCCHQNGLY
ncbi:LacI family DNA-binding transcriptional regulator [Paucilactobacillus hokkaidonensis]|uniref:LacI family DNA-binding transcriptional regulator n=1 Tax=Paucilactobacillus hokkaidonensis TaxID=1193095 RepID=UPI000B02C2E1|nr:LacI family DNA-binding transcriptional regulator [Paucilactobacillus hokkaidonensis]